MKRKLIRTTALLSMSLLVQSCVVSSSSSLSSSIISSLSSLSNSSTLSEIVSSLLSSISSSSDEWLPWCTTKGDYMSEEECNAVSSSASSMSSSVSSFSEVSSSSSIFSMSSSSSDYLSSSSSSQPISSSYSSSSDIIYEGYYYGADGLMGTQLVTFLRTITTTGFIPITYGDARYFMGEYDADPANSNNVLLIYNRASVSDVWDNGTTWNREHVWPQSRLGADAVNGTANICSDLHNLRAANPSINSSRGNKNFDNSTTTTSYYPGEADKGDIARILMYMAIRYPQLTLVNGTPADDGSLSIGNLTTLLQWHDQDPPDAFEIGRNQIIFAGAYVPYLNRTLKQNNRNPFVDHPEFADYIWNASGQLIN